MKPERIVQAAAVLRAASISRTFSFIIGGLESGVERTLATITLTEDSLQALVSAVNCARMCHRAQLVLKAFEKEKTLYRESAAVKHIASTIKGMAHPDQESFTVEVREVGSLVVLEIMWGPPEEAGEE